jgi:hypothetical protein
MSERICTYCGLTCALSLDHVPPKCLFAKPRPDLITVPSCATCNGKFSKDDEYLRLVLVSRHDTGAHRDAQGVWEAAMRGLGRVDQLGLAKRLLSRAKEVELRTSAGLHIGHGAVFEPEISRIEAVAIRIVRGLYYHKYQRRIPEAHHYRSFILDLVDAKAQAALALKEMVRKLTSSQPDVIGNRAFAFWHQLVVGQEHASAWLLEFYEHMHILVLV